MCDFDFLCESIHCVNEMRQKFAHCVKAKGTRKRCDPNRGTSPARNRGKELKLLFEENEDGFVKFFDRKAACRGSENGIVTGNSTQNTFRFAQRVQ